jgi:hypothetical protein
MTCRRFGRCRFLPLAVLAACALGGGCAAVIDPAAIADAQTAARVKTALVNDPDVGGRAIEVQVAAGIVTLSGRVQTAREAARVQELARSVEGVVGVRTNLQVGVEAPAPAEGQGPAMPPPGDELLELQPNPTLLAVGGQVGWTTPRAAALATRVTVSPLFRLGSGSGLGPAIGFDWFQANVRSHGAQGGILSRVHVKPVMAGLSYTLAWEHMSVSPAVVGGVSFNSLTVTDTGAAAGVPVEVDNSLVWRPGVSVWFDVGRRFALNVSGGYVMTRLRITVLEGGRLIKRNERGDTAVVHGGLAYKLF